MLVLFLFSILVILIFQPFFYAPQRGKELNKYLISKGEIYLCQQSNETACLTALPVKSNHIASNKAGNIVDDMVPPGFAFFFNAPFAINKASEKDLLFLPGIGPKTAQKILAHRINNGDFKAIDEMAEIKGIGPKTVHKIKPFVDTSL